MVSSSSVNALRELRRRASHRGAAAASASAVSRPCTEEERLLRIAIGAFKTISPPKARMWWGSSSPLAAQIFKLLESNETSVLVGLVDLLEKRHRFPRATDIRETMKVIRNNGDDLGANRRRVALTLFSILFGREDWKNTDIRVETEKEAARLLLVNVLFGNALALIVSAWFSRTASPSTSSSSSLPLTFETGFYLQETDEKGNATGGFLVSRGHASGAGRSCRHRRRVHPEVVKAEDRAMQVVYLEGGPSGNDGGEHQQFPPPSLPLPVIKREKIVVVAF